MTGSLRGLGYTIATALADIIDNSISASASRIEIDFHLAGERSFVRILDDGCGMEDSALESAMRLGARNPLERRERHDLGRFGLGLKTASFSQARRLTVASRTHRNSLACLRWDLALLASDPEQGWSLLEGPAVGSEMLLQPLNAMKSGTLVLWEDLDRLVTPDFGEDDMIDTIDAADAHLGMTFHRLLTDPTRPLKILLNGRSVQSWDPFMVGHPGKAQESSEYRLLRAEEVILQCHVLPHKDQLSSQEHERAAGPAGWVMQQGFYIYRNKRLLVPGGWLRLGERGRLWGRDEPHRLARIRLDIPNSADADWGIDVLKSTARPPVRLRSQLHRIARETRDRARRVFAHRGRLIGVGERGTGMMPDTWQAIQTPKGTSYRIDRCHPLVAGALDRSGAGRREVEAILRLIEQTVPVQRIWLDTADDRETPVTDFAASPDPEVADTLAALFEAMVRHQGLPPEEARARLARTRPFDRHPALIAALSLENLSS